MEAFRIHAKAHKNARVISRPSCQGQVAVRVRASTKESTASAGEDARDSVWDTERKARWPQQQVCVRWRVEQERPLRVTAARPGLEVGFHRIDHPCVAAPSRVSKRPMCVCSRGCILHVCACAACMHQRVSRQAGARARDTTYQTINTRPPGWLFRTCSKDANTLGST